MSDFNQNHMAFRKFFEHNKEITIEKFTDDIKIIEESIEFQFSLSDKIAKMNNSKYEQFKTKPNSSELKQMVIAANIFKINIKGIFAAYENTLYDFGVPSYIILRNVLENTIMMYYMVGHPEEINTLIEFIHQNGIILDKSRSRKKHFDKFKPSTLRKELYTGEQLKNINNIYAFLSYSVHSSFYEMNSDDNDPSRRIKDQLSYIKLLSIHNIHSTIENFSVNEEIYKKVYSPDVSNYFRRAFNNEFGIEKECRSFFPNHSGIEKKFKIMSNL